MTAPVLQAAKHLAKRSGWSLSNLQLQKILYLAHMFHLGRTGGEPLVTGCFQAWDYGPVHPVLYHRAKVFGADPVENIFHDQASLPAGAVRDILDEAWDSLKGVTAAGLVAATHREGGAWSRHYRPRSRGVIIPDQDILAEYQQI